MARAGFVAALLLACGGVACAKRKTKTPLMVDLDALTEGLGTNAEFSSDEIATMWNSLFDDVLASATRDTARQARAGAAAGAADADAQTPPPADEAAAAEAASASAASETAGARGAAAATATSSELTLSLSELLELLEDGLEDEEEDEEEQEGEAAGESGRKKGFFSITRPGRDPSSAKGRPAPGYCVVGSRLDRVDGFYALEPFALHGAPAWKRAAAAAAAARDGDEAPSEPAVAV